MNTERYTFDEIEKLLSTPGSAFRYYFDDEEMVNSFGPYIPGTVVFVSGDVSVLRSGNMYYELHDWHQSYDEIKTLFPDFEDPEPHTIHTTYLCLNRFIGCPVDFNDPDLEF